MKRRICLFCSEKPAKNLGHLQPKKPYASEPVFCSIHCAATYGLKLALDRAGYCDEHQQWADHMDDGCPICKEQEDHP